MPAECEDCGGNQGSMYRYWLGTVPMGMWHRECWGDRKHPFEPCGYDPGAPVSVWVDSGSTGTAEGPQISDPVNSPDHYRWLPVEAIEITEHFNFCMGNALKYLLRADHKGNPIDDLRKSVWYIQREIANREKGLDSSD